ncbi:MAG: AEC family transporter [Clostridia bacterium]|nr:AEC family transporter [Clostridia bacterium]
MEISLLLMAQIGKMFLMMLMGLAVVRAGVLTAKDSKILSVVTLYVIMPCMIIDSFQVDFTPEKLRGLGVAMVCAVAMHLIYIALSAILGKTIGLDAVEKASAAYGNGGNLIIPLVSAVFGREWVFYTSAFITVQTVLLWTHCRMMLCGRREFNAGDILKNINVVAIAIGCVLFASGLRFPSLIGDTISTVGGTIGVVSMIVTGMLLGGSSLGKVRSYRRVPLICLLRLILYPAVMLVIYRFTPLKDMAADGETILLVSFLAAAAPTASSVTQLAQVYGGDSEYAGVINMVSTLLCIVTLPLMVLLYQI